MKKKIFSMLLLLSAFTLSLFAQEGSEWLIKANRASLEKSYPEAIRCYTEYVKLNPTDFRGYFNRGTTEYNAGRYADAIADFSQCLTLNPIYKEAYYYRGKCCEEQNNYLSALADYSHVLRLDSLNVGFLKARAHCYTMIKRYTEALYDLDRAVNISKYEGEAYKQRAELKIAMQDIEGAVRDYEAVQRLLPKYKMVHYLKGNLFLELGETGEACREWRLAIDNRVAVAERNYESYCAVQVDFSVSDMAEQEK